MLEGTRIIFETNPDYEDEEGNEYFECPFCEGSGIGSEGDTADFGDEHTPMIMQISPDIPCGICDGDGTIREFSEGHFFAIKNKIFEIIQDTFGQEKIDSLTKKNLTLFYNGLENSINLLKPIFIKS